MSRRPYFVLFVLCVLAFACPLLAQTERPLTWQQDLDYLANASSVNPVEVRATLGNIRTEVENWLKLHPDSKIKLPPALAQTASADQTGNQIKLLQETVASILKEDPNRPFHLGTAEVSVSAKTSELSPIADNIDQTEIQLRNDLNVAQAVTDLPGVSIEHLYSGRNQDAVYVRGYGYEQVQLYVDGIPMSVPYDGYMDFNRFLTSDIAEVQIAKGFSSPLIGPNAIGGAINVVTREPQKKLEGEALMGTGSGDKLLSSLRIGSQWSRFFLQGGVDWLQTDYIPLSGNFVTNLAQPNDQLNHSNQQDAKYSGRIGLTPRGHDEYVFSYINQKANEGMPLFTGNDPLDPCSATSNPYKLTCWMGSPYRKWAYWDNISYDFHSSTGLGDKSSFKLRAFYDQYPNLMAFYTDASELPSVINLGYMTKYDDHADGFIPEFTTRLLPRNIISASFFFKDSTHSEIPLLTPATGPTSLSDREQETSIGLQDAISISEHFQSTLGFSANHLDGLRATDANTYGPLTCNGVTGTSYTACTPHLWTYNPQASVSYSLGSSGKLFAAFARKSRFPLIKEQYSSYLGSGEPNYNLKTEFANNWEFGYSRTFAGNTVAQVELFRSDLRDAIESMPIAASNCTSPRNGYCTQWQNVGKETHEGVEFTVRSTPLPRLTLDASYSYLNKTMSDIACAPNTYLSVNGVPTTQPNYTCLVPTDIPKHKAVTAATVRLPYQATLFASFRYEAGTKQVDSYSTSRTSPYYYQVIPMSDFGTMDLGGTGHLYKGCSLQAGVKNLFDRNYYYQIGYPEAGRNWYLNLRYKF
jgi:iron complex outermembrane receptor protein